MRPCRSRLACGTALLALAGALASARSSAQAWSPDAGAGRYRNPVVHADYSDPDVVRVGDDFYMTASSFNAVPALPLLHSRDLVHWRLVNHAIRRLPAAFDSVQHGNGVWAPSIRYHAGRFYIYYGDPDRGIYVVRTREILGTWDPPVLVQAAKGWIDPAPLWDDDGNAYLVHAFANSRAGIKSVLHVNRMSPDGLRLLDQGTLVFDGHANHPTIEGPKFYKRNGWYYIFAPAGGVTAGWQAVLRSRQVLGPYEARVVLRQGGTRVNGPHQGAWVQTPLGEDWFLHFQDAGPYGRITHLQPVRWRNDWPVIGAAADTDTVGEPVEEFSLPRVRAAERDMAVVPQTSDDFNARVLGLQWQWQGNPRDDWFELPSGRARLRLAAQRSPAANGSLWPAPNLLLQKLPADTFTATVRLVLDPHDAAATAGLIVFGADYAYVGVQRTSQGSFLVQRRALDANGGAAEDPGERRRSVATGVWLRVVVGRGAVCQFAVSEDGAHFEAFGAPFQAKAGRWVGAKLGLFARLDEDRPARGATAEFEAFRVTR